MIALNIFKIFVFIISLFLVQISAHSQTEKQFIKGFIIDRESLSDVSGVHVYNQHRMGTVSDSKGFFQMTVNTGDTITFSRIDYDIFTITIEAGRNYSEMLISMRQKVYILDSVDVYSGVPEPTHLYRQEPKPVYIPGITKQAKDDEDYSTSFGEAVTSPATALYNAFSKKYKEEKKYHEIIRTEKQGEALEGKGYDLLEEYLKTQDLIIPRDRFEDLLDYCGVTTFWLASANEYDVYIRMHSCIKNFLSGRPKD